MAADNKKEKKMASALSRLTPNAIRVVVDGEEIVVANNQDENNALNMVLAAQMRNLIQVTLKGWKDRGIDLTPKELKEITEAAKNAASFSTEVYAAAAPLSDSKPMEKAAPAEPGLGDVKFDGIILDAKEVKEEPAP